VEEPRELKSLTEQERRILEYVAEGLTNREIAGKMFLAEKTVKNYVSSLLAKLGLERCPWPPSRERQRVVFPLL
jgi:DNA-binding NarL/FixJ family response regulator